MSDPNDGVPGQEPEPTVLTNDTQNALISMAVGLLKALLYVLFPPLYLYRGRPILDRLAKWRWIYTAFLLMATLVSVLQFLDGAAPTALLLAPVFHLILAAAIIFIAVAVVPGVSSSSGALPIALVLVACALLMAFAVGWFRAGIDDDVETDKVHLNPAADEYVIPMTEVWDSGGKYDN